MAKETFGEYLKRERELRGISLETIAEETKISVSILAAIEAEDWGKLPAQVFVRGFIRNYAQVIGLDPNEVILRYETLANPPKEEEDDEYVVQISGDEEKVSLGSRSKKWLWLVVILVVIVVAFVLGFRLWQTKKMSPIVPEATSSQIPQRLNDKADLLISPSPPELPPEEEFTLPTTVLPLIQNLGPHNQICAPEGFGGPRCQIPHASNN
ncbi:helix-turn-helix domain-containing protein [Thermosulfuriphilus ammonigenes]|uniref:Helix-turn-helix domain-containing protein n=1 Tax=Thermosulfuriphilus ammonigenes TaxID=1936021 RepID=A0A6G7PT49_9BACT|nr:helix-turn-helix domain-containing protein [Thermosulfuriphilus ammonigenes]MBA2849240.1 cytoskeletal protein RodZ [Thermosulfuriphilus ammonigenes]QIJ70855.1 helix-turn-helix domain-containing protein [Thermosulfuriphilus ammonigenes]